MCTKFQSPQSRIRNPKFAAEDLQNCVHQLVHQMDFRLQALDPESVDKDP